MHLTKQTTGHLVVEATVCRNTNPVPHTHQSSFAAPYIKISAQHGNKTWATHPEIHIHYRGMHAFHLQYGLAGAVLIFIPFSCFVWGTKACFSPPYLNPACREPRLDMTYQLLPIITVVAVQPLKCTVIRLFLSFERNYRRLFDCLVIFNCTNTKNVNPFD